MADDDDWRLHGKEHLKGITLRWKRYVWQPDWNPEWDHDHCDFCTAKFMDVDLPDVLRAGYTNTEQIINDTVWAEGALWICHQCFEDFHERFDWSVAGDKS